MGPKVRGVWDKCYQDENRKLYEHHCTSTANQHNVVAENLDIMQYGLFTVAALTALTNALPIAGREVLVPSS